MMRAQDICFRVGDEITQRCGWGSGPLTTTKIEQMEVTEYPREKYGEPVKTVTFEQVVDNRVVFTLSNGHWCYSNQVVLPEGVK